MSSPSSAVELRATDTLPADGFAGALAGRVWRPDVEGPSVVAIRADGVYDISASFPTMRDLCESDNPASRLKSATGPRIAAFEDILANTPPGSTGAGKPSLLTPIDLQAVKAAGVTFATSTIERVIEERAGGKAALADKIRQEIHLAIGGDLHAIKPGSQAAAALKQALIARNMWSQYLEVAIGPDAEIFTKAQPLSAVGTGMDAGLHPISTWNNPEPEVVLIVTSDGRIVGATLGNDVNLRDVEGRSALLLSKAKDNNASCAIGPLIRFFDSTMTLDTVRNMTVSLKVTGDDGFVLDGVSYMNQISRDPADLVLQMVGPHHQYPDGAALFLGTLFAPVKDRDAAGQGFTHHIGDIVTIASAELGSLTNRMRWSTDCAPWHFGASHLMRNLARRGLL